MLFCILAILITIGHFNFVVFLHNWFYSKPFPRLLGDLIQATHILFGFFGLFFIYTLTLKTESFLIAPHIDFLPDLFLGYGLFCLFVVAILFPINEFFRNCWALSPYLYKQISSFFDYENHFVMNKPFNFLNDSFKLEIVAAEISTEFLPVNSQLKILHISDFHFGGNDNYAYYQFVLAQIDAEVYDFAFFTGDLVDNVSFLRWVVPLLKKIKTKHGKFAVLGNHDLWNDPDMVRKYLRKAGFTCLSDQWCSIEYEGKRIGIFGNEFPWFSKKLPDLSPDVYDIKILLTHSPDEFFWAANQKFNLMFCGHVHGGQISLPFFGPLLIPSKFGRRFGSGFFSHCGMIMHVSRGLAGSFPLRINCKPEVTIISLVSKQVLL